MMAGIANRQGMIFVDDHDDEEDSPPPVMTGSYHEHGGGGGGLQQPGSPVSSSGVESEGSYAEVYSDDSYHSDGDEIAEIWDPYLYQLQMQAPKAKCVPCLRRLPDRPYYYGEEYHGSITRDETAHLLGNEDGNYLVRQGLSQSGSYSLSFVFGGSVRHYRLYFEGNDHYVGEKPFETIEDLVQDGLITLHMEANNVEEYLRSARETRLTHSTNLGAPPPDPPNLDPIQETPPVEHPVFFEPEELSSRSSSDCMPRKPPYYPCTIPQRHSSVNSPPLPELSKEESKRILMKGYVPPHHHHHPSSPTSPLSSHHPHSSQHTHNGTVDIVTPGSPIKSRKESSIYYYEKPHNFKLHSYIGMMAWCDSCRNFMWGLRNQGYKCKDCGYNAHKQCKDETAPNCQPTKQLVKRVYGVELTTLVKMQCTKVPVVVKSCIEEIERRGMDAEGIYRISGKTNDILRIKKEFDNNMDANLKSVDDIHALTGAMKLYLRELPVPLMTFDAYDICLIAARSGSIGESLDMLRVALERLPPAHYNTLRHLMRHLHKVQQLKSTNKMDSKNLALVFTPSLMRSPYNNSGMMAMQKLPEQKKAVDLLIQHFHSLFN